MALTTSQHWTIIRLTYWYLDRRRWEEAESLARGLLSLDEDDGLAWHYYGEARFQQNDESEAARAFDRAAKLLEDRADVWMRLGETLLRLGNRAEARKALEEARRHADEEEMIRRIELLFRQRG